MQLRYNVGDTNTLSTLTGIYFNNRLHLVVLTVKSVAHVSSDSNTQEQLPVTVYRGYGGAGRTFFTNAKAKRRNS